MSFRFGFLCLVPIIALAAVLPTVATAQGAPGFGQQPAPAGVDFEQMSRIERQDFGIAPTRQLHAGAMHGPTPSSIPGGQVVTTQGIVALMQGRQAPFVVVDVLGQPETLPNAVAGAWLAQPGAFNDQVQRQAEQMLGQITQGRKDVALIFYCLSRECWMSYNAALRSIQAGYTNVLWYRGGVEAWKAAGLPTQQGQQGQQGQQSPQPPQPLAGGQFPQAPQFQPGQPFPQPQGPASGGQPRALFTPVRPLPAGQRPADNRPPAELRVTQGRFFAYAIPQGWTVGEEAQYALTRISPDGAAMTLLVGNAGMMLNTSAADYAYKVLSAIRPQNLQLGQPRQARPAAGFNQAVEFDVRYWVAGAEKRGVAKVSVAPGYDTKAMIVTASVTTADQWQGYSSWLPLIADQVSVTNGAAFGRRGVMQQNLQNSIALGQAAKEYREWSQKTWQGVTDDRNRSVDARNFAFRENIGGVKTYANPFGSTPPLEMPTTHSYYWSNGQGGYVGTDDPRADPNVGSTGNWRRMERINP